MKYFFMLTALSFTALLHAQPRDLDTYPVYTGRDLGLSYSSRQSFFRIWAPVSTEVQLVLYRQGTGGQPVQRIDMVKSTEGTFTAIVPGDQAGKFYSFSVLNNGIWMEDVADPYMKIAGINGQRGLIADLAATNPKGWAADKSPLLRNVTDAVIYELHVRDASIATNAGIRQKGKFNGLTERGTRNGEGLSTGLDHLKELGITHVHLLPSFDYNSVDEASAAPQYNWGYDPLNYNVPEGSYATNAADGTTRIKEFKQLVQTFHQNGLRVIMDVVYNHTAQTAQSNFNKLVPGYYYRQNKDGQFSDATACGNEIASERAMVRKFILESVKYWVEEYHIDGFRFDLMGVHDITTMNLVSRELHKIKPDILLYGEGWTAGASPLPDSQRALKVNVARLENIAVFSDDIRDGIKGSVFDHHDKGFASGKPGMEESIKFGIVAACPHPQIDYNKVNYSKAPYATSPAQVITYAECHDNHVLWDKLAISAGKESVQTRRDMHKLALSIVLTSQGISFLHAGTEFLRSKKGVENSYNAGDSINAIDWSLKSQNKDVFDYVKGLIALRKAHPAFRMSTAKQIATHLVFKTCMPPGVIAYTINGKAIGDSWNTILVIINGTDQLQSVKAGNGWKTAIDGNHFVKSKTTWKNDTAVPPYSCTILYQ